MLLEDVSGVEDGNQYASWTLAASLYFHDERHLQGQKNKKLQ